jgi:UDP-N-acetylglucosamine--N-acetylmuramyl-(pentapeptide) pyrophosphoryl-undecaprenol N-acetylglucosamine transferase
VALRVVLTGGGSGGHIYPLLAVAQEIKRYDPEAQFLWIGSSTGQEAEIAKQADIEFRSVPTGKMRRYFSFQNFIDIFKVPFGVASAFSILGGFKPHVVFSKGGFVSYPTVFAAWLRDVPILLHETDSVPGLANRRLSKKATLIATGFPIVGPELPKQKTVFTGNPVRREMLGGSAERARTQFGLSSDKPVLAVLGGSQGAVSINKVIQQLLPELLPHFQIIHQVGPNNLQDAQESLQKFKDRGYRAVGFLGQEMADVYALADIVIARAGGALFELAALAKPSIILPLAGSASNHQVMNAYAFQRQGAASMFEEPNLTPQLLLGELLKLVHDPELRGKMSHAIAKFDAPHAAQKIAYWIFRLAELR